MEKNKSEAIEKALNEYIRQIASDLDKERTGYS